MLSYRQVDKQLEPILREMEKRGVKLDVTYLEKMGKKLGKELNQLQTEIVSDVGHEFNIDSPRQLAEVLYKELDLAGGEVMIRKTKSHQSTSASELTKLIGTHPVVEKILNYREKKKLKSTYLDPLPKLVDQHSRVHTSYSIDTAAGRLSSKDPNLQNIPVKTEDGRKIRQAFIASEGYKIIAIDYSQIQLRIAAHFSKDPSLIKIFQDGDDIHSATAKKMGVERYVAKTINFGVLFGQTPFALSEFLHIPQAEAQAFIEQYFASFPKLAKWMEKIKKQAYELGYVETLLGRKRWLGELKTSNFYLRSFAERVAVNHPIQGTEADIMKLAMIEIAKEVKDSEALMIMQVHDELVFEVPNNKNIQKTTKKIAKIMEGAIKLNVPIKTEAKVGKNWGELENI